MSASGAVFNSFDFEGQPIKRKLALREQEPEGVTSDSITWVQLCFLFLGFYFMLFYRHVGQRAYKITWETCGTVFQFHCTTVLIVTVQ